MEYRKYSRQEANLICAQEMVRPQLSDRVCCAIRDHEREVGLTSPQLTANTGPGLISFFTRTILWVKKNKTLNSYP